MEEVRQLFINKIHEALNNIPKNLNRSMTAQRIAFYDSHYYNYHKSYGIEYLKDFQDVDTYINATEKSNFIRLQGYMYIKDNDMFKDLSVLELEFLLELITNSQCELVTDGNTKVLQVWSYSKPRTY